MEKIKSFVNITTSDYHFKGCKGCLGQCCNGKLGYVASPLIVSDFESVYEYFAILFSFADEKVIPYVILNDGKSHCKYYEEDQCTIYDKRPPACRLYPISPYYDAIYVDTQCPSINECEEGERISKEGKLNEAFYTDRLENFKSKLEATQRFLESISDLNAFEHCITIANVSFYQYVGMTENIYLKMHQSSLVHLTTLGIKGNNHA